MRREWIATVSVLALVAVGCDSRSTKSNQGAHRQTRNHRLLKLDKTQRPIEGSFAITNAKARTDAETQSILSGTLEQGSYNAIKLNKDSLGKLFLLTPTMVVASNFPIIDHAEPKLVTFQQSGDKLALYEVNFDVVYDDFDANKLLQVFDVVSQDEQALEFQWNFGLEFLPVDSPYVVSDMPSTATGKMYDTESPVVPITKSFVKDLTFANNSLFVEQVSRVRTQGLAFDLNSILMAAFGYGPLPIQTNDLTVHLTMEIAPYTPSPNFSAKKSAMDDGIGYFETLSLKKGTIEPGFNAMRWDIGPGKEPVTYAITRSVPTDMEAAVREGILYWNKVLGFEGIRVETGADPKSRPQDKRVLVHWINWEDAGFARASMQADPITGEIKRGDVYMTSVFREGAKVTARRLQGSTNKKVGSMVPAGFSNKTTCTLKYSDFEAHQPLYTHNQEPENLERAARDMVRAVVAHEVGHTLGLRHNFAGSQDSHVETHEDLDELRTEYFANPNHPGAVTSNSVMDYLPTFDDILLGAKIKTQPLAYDKLAIDWGYNGGAVPSKTSAPSFCTDGLAYTGATRGCEPFDTGANGLNSAAGTLLRQRTQLTREYLDTLLRYRFAKDFEKRISVEKLLQYLGRIPIADHAADLASPLRSAAELLAKETRLFSIDRLFDGVGPTWYNKSAYENAATEKLRHDLATVGDFEGLIAAAYPMKPADDNTLQPEHGWLRAQVLNYVDSPEFRSGRTLEGVEYELSTGELAQVRSFVAKLADEFEGMYLAAVLQSVFPRVLVEEDSSGNVIDLGKLFGGSSEFIYRDSVVASDWAKSISGLVRSVVLSSEENLSTTANGTVITLPKSLYRSEARIAALSGLDSKTFATNGWLKGVRTEITSAVTERLKTLCGGESTSVDEFKEALKELQLDKAAREWADSELKVLEALKKLDE